MRFRHLTRACFVLLAGVVALGMIHPGAVMGETTPEFKLTPVVETISGYSAVAVSGDYSVIVSSWEAHVFKYEENSWNFQAKLISDDPNFSARAVAISGDYAVVGGGSRGAYVFKREADVWNQQAKLTGLFVQSLAIADNYVIAGSGGEAYIFKREEDVWHQQATLTPGVSGAGEFGFCVSISGDYAIVGDYIDDENGKNSGAAYIFRRDGDTWTQQIKLMPKDSDLHDMFGISVSVSGDYATVGTFGLFSGGSVYVFKHDGEIWKQQSRLFFKGGLGSLTPVTSVAVSGDYAVAGTHGSNGGTAYIFKRKGGTWIQLSKLVPDDPSEIYFGIFVSVSENYAIIGTDSGSAYIQPLSELGETAAQEVSGDSPVYFDFSDDLGSGQSSIVIIPTEGSGNISVTQYADALETLPEAVTPIGPVYDIDGSEYTSESGTTVAFSWDTPLPDVGGVLLVSTDGENWIDAATDPGITDIEWNLDSPPYSVSFRTTHFSKWAIVTEDPVTDLSTATDLVGKENDGGVEFVRNDVNEDGIVDIFDVLAIIDQDETEADTDIKKEAVRNLSETFALMGAEDDSTPEFAETDANGDGVIDVFDMLYFIDRMNETD